MSLVPIIYTSLILFFGLLVIVLFFSYLSFRARAKANPLIEEIKKNQKSIYSAPKPIVKRETQIIYKYEPHDYNSLKTNRETIYNEERVNQQPIVVRSNYFEHPGSNYQKSLTQKTIYESGNYRPKYNASTRLTRTRIEIMNDTEKYSTKRQSMVYAEQPSINLPNRDISHLNILNFYSDNVDNDLNSMMTVPLAKSV